MTTYPQLSNAVECHAVIRDFDGPAGVTRVLRGIDLEIPGGEISMLVGPSGCGKTTLISIIAGILTPTGGDVRVFGESLAEMSQKELVAFRRKNIGFIFQQYNLLPALTAVENTAVPLIAAGVTRKGALSRAAEMLEPLGMGQHRDKRPAQLSGGQQQRVAIARALAHSPRLIVCDEPTAALDASSGHAVMTLLREVAVHPERSVIVVTHDNRIFSFADRIAHMNDGLIESIEERALAA